MRVLTLTLVTDGTSDRALVPLVEWLLTVKVPEHPFAVRMAEGLPAWGKGLAARVRFAHAMYPSDALIIHRDSEAGSWTERVEQIAQAVSDVQVPSWIPIIPVRMTEAWFLCDQRSIRRAAGRPADVVDLRLPHRRRWELEPDPKEILFSALRIASGLTGRRLSKFDLNGARARVANLIDDFSYLRGMTCFDDFEKRIDHFLANINLTVD
jgi:hypothetical protein